MGEREAVAADLVAFVKESNRIEGIRRPPTTREVEAHKALLALGHINIWGVIGFVHSVQPGADLRNREGMNVRVGAHVPPPGSPDIEAQLERLLDRANAGADPFAIHLEYETLHPFMDGNGRSGRAVWLWMMLDQGKDPYALSRGFLHTFYYQSLSAPSPS